MFKSILKTANGKSMSRVFAPAAVQQKCFSSNSVNLKVGIILSGSGVYDGSEITEAVSSIVHLSSHGCELRFFAPDVEQEVVNHLTGETSNERRNVLVESARIARGKVEPLSAQLAEGVDSLDGYFFPGGFGVAKNLSNFASAGADMKVQPEVEKLLLDAQTLRKPTSFVCIAPILAAKVFGSRAIVTVGQDKDDKGAWPSAETASVIKQWGAEHQNTNIDGQCIDAAANITSGCAYMSAESKPHQVFDNIGNVVDVFVAQMLERKRS